MQEKLKHNSAREMHKYVVGLVGVFVAMAVSYPIAFLRVSQHKNFTGFHVKSLTLEGKPANLSTESVAVVPYKPVETIPSATVPSQVIASNNTKDSVLPSPVAETNQLANVANPPVTNNLAMPPFISSSTNSIELPKQVGEMNGTNPVVEINEQDQIKELNQKLYNQIAQVWQAGRRLKRSIAYRVTVTPDGTIASYEPLLQPAFDYVQDTPLPQLMKFSFNKAEATTEKAIAKFKVVFTQQGILEVSPWEGWKRK